LKQFRQARGITQAALSASIAMDTAYLSRLENDATGWEPSPSTIERIATSLKLTTEETDELYTLAGHVPPDLKKAIIEKPGLIQKIRDWLKGGEQ